MEITVDAEIRSLIPPLRAKEFEYLEASLRTYGCHAPLKVWGCVLLDGHKRLEICRRHRIPYKTEQVDLSDRDAALLWVDENQLLRHDLTDDQRAALAVRVLRKRTARRNAQAAAVPLNGLAAGNGVAHAGPLNQTVMAKEARVSERRVRDAVTVEKADADLFQTVFAGDKSLLQAKRELVARRRRADRLATAAAVKRLAPGVRAGDFRYVLADLPDNSVDLIFTDPPYDKMSVPMYGDLAALAGHVLVPGGSLVCYAGVHALPRLFPLMMPHLAF